LWNAEACFGALRGGACARGALVLCTTSGGLGARETVCFGLACGSFALAALAEPLSA
jgi:hypothetical protein